MIVPYTIHGSDKYYKNYYENQIGNGLAVFKGATVQRGHGIGGFFSNLFKGAMPVLKSGLKTVGKELLSAGVDIARDALQGKDVKTTAKRRMLASGDNLLSKFSDKMRGSGLRPIKRRHRAALRNCSNKAKKRKTAKGGPSLFKNVDVVAA